MKSTQQHVLVLLKRLGVILLLFIACRILFLAFNYSNFQETSLGIAFIGGLRFDLSAIAILNLPLIFLSLLPGPWLKHRKYQQFLVLLLGIVNIPALVFNLIDCEYFKFTSKRVTADFFDLMLLSDDMAVLLPTYIRDYWHILLLLAALIWGFVFLVKRAKFDRVEEFKLNYIWQSLALVLMVGLSVLAYRGGTQLRPIDDLSALSYGRPQDIPLIINSPFSIIRSWGKDFLIRKDYVPLSDLEQIYSPVHIPTGQADLADKNIIIVIMESFSKEYVGRQNEAGYPYTPFLDSLSQVGVSFEKSYANGRTSITALPSILSGLPALMDQPLITSPYNKVQSDGLPHILSKHGYTSHFFHGGQTGTMGFDKYCKSIGFDSYSGMEDYPDQSDYDGNWGIYDGAFFPFVVEELAALEPPFLSTLFSLSSHHPYTLPIDEAHKYTEYPDELGRSIRYADDVLKQFFANLEVTGLLKESLVIVTADHIPFPKKPEFFTPLGCFSVPIVFYDQSGRFKSECQIAQQTDIQPTVIEYLGLPDEHIGWGKSLISCEEEWAIQYLNSFYQLYENGYMLRYDGVDNIKLARADDPYVDIENPIEATMLPRLKAMIQQYHNRLIDDELRSEE